MTEKSFVRRPSGPIAILLGLILLSLLFFALSLVGTPDLAQAATTSTPLISEFRPNPNGDDPTLDTVELSGTPNTSFSGYFISIESDNVSSMGRVDRFTEITGTFDSNGLLTASIADLENPSFSVALVSNFTGSTSTDIDTDNDGVADDLSALGTVYDAIGVPDATADEAYLYGSDLGGIDFAYTGGEPRLIFREGSTGDLYAVNDLGDNKVYNTSAVDVTAAIFDTDPTAGSDTFGSINPSILVAGPDDLSLSKTVSPTSGVAENDTVTYILVLTSSGASSNALITDSLPVDTAFSSWVTQPAGATNSGNLVTWGGMVSRTQSITLVFTAQNLATSGTVANTAEYSGTTSGTADASYLILGSAPLTYTTIYEIQGNGSASPFNGSTINTLGAVVGDFQSEGLAGFYIQDLTGDGDPTTSDGIFVYEGDALITMPDINIGDIVEIAGTVDEYFDMTQIGTVTGITVSGSTTISPTLVTLPMDDTMREQYEGMLIEIDEPLYVTELYELGRYGQILLSENDRLYQYTQQNSPSVAGYTAYLADIANSSIKINDHQSGQNPDPLIYPSPQLSETNSIRGGSEVNNLTGVVNYSFGEYMIEPVETVVFEDTNVRPSETITAVGRLKVASLNVLNFFTTIDSGSSICGPASSLDCRGADSASELTRQRDKVLQALVGMDADVVGLIEIENDTADAPQQSLVDGLNALLGSGTYDYIATGAVGDDAIRVGFIYKTATIQPVGSFAVLDDSVDPTFVDDKNRPALAQTFQELATGESFTAAVNHFKSKGSDCDALSDPDLGDGAGNCNLTRTNAASSLANWLASDPTSSGDPDFLILGDLNAYAQETPITTLQAAGYTDLAASLIGPDAYSFVFDGQWGTLDYALANGSLVTQVVSVKEWHINADEPIILDYNTEFKSAGQLTSFYAANAYRSSDHDPIIVGLTLGPVPTQPLPITGTISLSGTAQAQLDWNDTLHDSYQIARSAQPYTGFNQYDVVLDSERTVDVSPTENYFYQIHGTWASNVIDTSTTLGVFRFALTPGTP